MFDWLLNFEWNGLLGILLYWVPLLFCALFYTIRTAEGYMADKRNLALDVEERRKEQGTPYRSLQHYYHPTETIGGILGRALVSVTPVANIWAALFDLSPKVFSRLFGWLGKVFDQPLVPKPRRD
jgi:hypothetical protein